MTTLVTADLHLNDHPRDAYRHAFMKKLPSVVENIGADWVIILGDITDEKDRHSAWLVNQIVEHLTNLAKVVQVTIPRGNHDYIDEDNPFFTFVKHIKNLEWINVPTSCGGWIFLPHTRNYIRDWKDIKFKDYDIVFAHQTFAGALVNGRTMGGIPLSALKGCGQIISGDIHEPQTVANKLTYVGAPYTVDFGDNYIPRMLLLDDKGNRTEVNVAGPQKRLVNWSEDELSTLNAGDIIKVRVQTHGQNWADQQDEIRVWAKRNKYILHTIQPVFERSTSLKRMDMRDALHKHADDTELLKQYALTQDLSEPIVKTGKWLMDRT